MSMRQAFDRGLGVRLPEDRWLYKGIVYEIPARGIIFRRASTPSGFTGCVFRASARQIENMMAAGHIPAPSLRV